MMLKYNSEQILFAFLQKYTFRFPDEFFFDFLPATFLHVY
jgi:hypothetical protein